MIDHIWSVLCSRSIVDSETNTVSIHDVIEQIKINTEPVPDGFLPISLEVITLWGRAKTDTPDEGVERVLFETPSGKSIVVSEARIDLSAAQRHRQRVKFTGLRLGESGRYYFKVELKNGDEWKQVAAIPITVIFESPKE
jgi:hypothetical protein